MTTYENRRRRAPREGNSHAFEERGPQMDQAVVPVHRLEKVENQIGLRLRQVRASSLQVQRQGYAKSLVTEAYKYILDMRDLYQGELGDRLEGCKRMSD